MLDNEQADRDIVVHTAKSFLRTPYHHMGKVKGGGVDCLTFLALTFEEAGLISNVQVDYYPKDIMLHRDAERYLEGLLEYAREIDGPPLPGDIVLWKFGRCYSHGAIVVQWPTIIHACVGRNVSIDDAEAAAWLTHIGENTADSGKPRPKRFFSFWGR